MGSDVRDRGGGSSVVVLHICVGDRFPDVSCID